jgi:biotin operon repressor
MKWITNVKFMDRVVCLMKRKGTGDAVALAKKLEMSERNVHRLIKEMREAGFPVVYCKVSQSYVLEQSVTYEFRLNVGDEELLRIKGGKQFRLDTHHTSPSLEMEGPPDQFVIQAGVTNESVLKSKFV